MTKPINIKDLTLDDLFSGLDAGKIQTAAGKSRTGREKLGSMLSRDNEREAMIAEAARRHRETQKKISPWIPEAVVLCQVVVTCKCCQTQYTTPASDTLLTRFRHRRDGSTWEPAYHPSQMNPDLPKEIKTLERTVLICQNCFPTNGPEFYQTACEEGGSENA